MLERCISLGIWLRRNLRQSIFPQLTLWGLVAILSVAYEAGVQAQLPAPSLSAPSNGATGVSVNPTFSWTSVSGANRYWLIVATSPSTLPTNLSATSCTACIISGNTTSLSYTTPNTFPDGGHQSTLSSGTTYYWRVQGWNTNGTQGNYSSIFSFTTASAADTTPPTFSAFDVNPRNASTGGTFTITYTISDSGGSGLQRAELWRAPDSGGVPGTWANIRTNFHSGNGPVSSSFSDSLSVAGSYWYGMHIFDNAGNQRNEPAPIKVTVTVPDTTPPTFSAFDVNPRSASTGGTFTITYTISDSGGSGLQRAELWRAPDSGGVPGTWANIRTNFHSGNGPVSSSFSDSLSVAGSYWYGMHIFDNAGNQRNEPAPIKVTVTSALLAAPTLFSPSNGASGVSVNPTFSWSSVTGANRYWVMVATSTSAFPTDPAATSCPSCVISGNTDATTYTVPNTFPYSGRTTTLNGNSFYYWKVQAWNTNGAQGNYPSAFNFTTVGDTTPPTFSAFDVNPRSTSTGGSFTISYTISDSGGSGLQRAELWRAPDSGGVPGTWANIRTNFHSGNGPVSSSFSDSLSTAGSYWYGMHIFDNAGNQRNEPAPIKVTVTAPDTTPPTFSAFDVNPRSTSTGGSFTISYTISDSGGSGLQRAELWRAPDSGGSPGTWANIRTNFHSGNGPVSSSFSDSLSTAGSYWYGMHIFDNAGNQRNEPAPIKVTRAGDTTAPTLSSLVVNPTNITFGNSFTISYTIADTGGSGLNRAELWRAPDSGGSPGTWSYITSRAHVGNGPISSTFIDTVPTIGSYWYGLHAVDNAGNVRYEPHPLGPVNASVNSTTCGTAENIRTRIQNRLQFLATSPPIEYLPATSWQAAVVSFNLQAYDEVYYSALDLRGLANSALSRATRSLNAGDLDSACTYLRRGERYINLMLDTEATAVLVFNDRVTGISEIARTIASKSCEADATLFAFAQGLGPKASLAVDMVCLPVDYVLDRSMYGKEQALKNLSQTIRTQVLGKVIIRTIPLPSLGGKTIYQYLSNGVTHEIGSSDLYRLLGEVIQNPNIKQEIMKALADLGERAIIDYGVERLACEYLSWLEDSIGVPTNSDCSPLAHFADAATVNIPGVVGTSPERNAAYVSTSLTAIVVKFTEPIVLGTKPFSVLNSNGTPLTISGKTIQNDTLTITLGSPLSLGNVYSVILPADCVRSFFNSSNQQFSWKFSTPPSALTVGGTVIVANTGGVGLNLRSSPTFVPDGSNIIFTFNEGQRLQIIGGPIQSGGYNWWNVTDNNFNGWAATGDWLTATDGFGLRISGEVTVNNTSVGLDLRDAPSSTAQFITKLNNGSKLVLLSGPYYVDGYLWWNVNSSSGSGYVAVAYWLFPTSDGLAPVIFTEEGTNRAFAVDSVTRTRGPFNVSSNSNFVSDHHTRIMLFTSNLGLAQSDKDLITVRAGGMNLLVENVGAFPSLQIPNASYIVVRLPDGLPAGDLPLELIWKGVVSVNSPTISISSAEPIGP